MACIPETRFSPLCSLMPHPKTLQEVLISLIRTMGDGVKETAKAGALLKVMLDQSITIKPYLLQEVRFRFGLVKPGWGCLNAFARQCVSRGLPRF
jgi:hypothetical protein